MNNLYLIDKKALYEDICKIEDEYRKSLLKEENYNTYEAQQKQGLLNATTLIKHFIFDYPIVEDYKYEINNLKKNDKRIKSYKQIWDCILSRL